MIIVVNYFGKKVGIMLIKEEVIGFGLRMRVRKREVGRFLVILEVELIEVGN